MSSIAKEAANQALRRGVPKGANHWARTLPSITPKDNFADVLAPKVDIAHFEPLGTWSSEKLNQSRKENPFMMTWVPSSSRHKVPNMTHGEGVYLYDDTGKQYLDWTSQAVCANLGHDIPESVVEAAAYQMRQLPFTYGGIGITEVRTRLNQLMGEILPGDLRAAVYPSSGAEANEAGIMMAKRFTGRQKVISWYRSYHGATAHAGAATGDLRRWYGSDSVPGFIKAFNPFPLFFRHGGSQATEQEQVETALLMLEEQILNEGPDNIASIVMESIVGAGGCLVMPDGYMQGIRALCDKYGILMHVDEVMVGFGRTGTLFGFQNYEGVMPDIVSCAKGISSAAIPLSMTACNSKIMEFFEDKPLGWGSTYQAHPVAMAVAYENIKYLLQNNVVGRAQNMSPLFEACMQKVAEDHPSIKQYRCIGLFGCFDVHDFDGQSPKLQHEVAHEAFAKYKEAYLNEGLVGLHRYPHIHCAPPLNIKEEELIDGFQRLDRALTVLDEALGYPVEKDRPKAA
ncbi:aminotransferase [Nitzschia inconspicua]|uniref:Aminotransferase n=1 Tax=Nitzschia inconspicua TaxID=303405 RepID=A0A9K3K800_9STRA|nr:aminotransferase [Nitzschia inconspicua]KAG7362915.1 aminotransferase [Nitzschia inconspicua]